MKRLMLIKLILSLLFIAVTSAAIVAIPPEKALQKPAGSPDRMASAGNALAQPEKVNPAVERAETILKKSLTAYGGEEKILSIKDAVYHYRLESEAEPGAKPVLMKTYFKGDTLFRSEVVGDKQETITILNGDKGWVRVGGTTLHLSKNEIIPLKNGLAIQFRPDLLLLSFPKHRFTLRTEENDRTLDQIDVSGFLSGEYVRGRLSIDVATNLLYKYEFELEREFPSGKGIIRGEEKFLQYREVEGLKMPSEIVSKQGRKVSRLIVEKAEFNSMIPDSWFQDPTPVNAVK